MKILIYTFEFIPHAGGVATYNYELAKGLSELGQDVIVLAPKYSDEDVILDKQMPFNIVRMNFSILNAMRLNRNIIRSSISAYYFIKTLQHYNPDRILVTQDVAHESAALARLFHPFRFILTVHGTEVHTHFPKVKSGWWLIHLLRQLRSRLIKWFFHKADRIICVSSFTENLLNEKVKFSKNKTTVIRNGINFQTLVAGDNKSRNKEIRKKLKLEGNKVLLTVGRLTPRKGQDTVIKALPQVIRNIPNVKYVIVGTGNYRQFLEKIVREKGVSDRVVFAGEVSKDDLKSYYELCDIFIMLSRRSGHTVEGLGISFLEAMAFSKPLIGGNHGGVNEVIENGKTGLLIDPTDVNAATEAICSVLKNGELAESLGKAGRKKVEEVFSRKSMAEKTLELL